MLRYIVEIEISGSKTYIIEADSRDEATVIALEAFKVLDPRVHELDASSRQAVAELEQMI